MMLKTETNGDDAAEEWSTPVNWEEDLAIKAERRRRRKHRINRRNMFFVLKTSPNIHQK